MTNKHVVHDIVLWRNSQWDYGKNRPLKKQRIVRFMPGHQKMRWEDNIHNFITELYDVGAWWMECAQQREA